jgi:hypothetical protein
MGLREDEPCKSVVCTKPQNYAPRWLTDRAMPQWERELRTGNPGETLGMEDREAGHAYLTRIAKEKPE